MRWFFFLLTAFFIPLVSQGQTTVAGSTPGSFRVTESGAAEYRIPIQVAPGIAGMEPRLALVYNSQAGNGLLGVGWNLEGLSSITRCPRTMAQDGVRGAINYDMNDRYCLDGQRLVMISGSSYGSDGAEYRTERESFSKVISYGSAGNGPAWFKVWTKGGQILEYGNTVDSRIEAQGKASVRVWTMNKASDAKGNYLTVAYTEDAANGDFYPARIDYTGNVGAGLASNASIRFSYEPRPDVNVAYAAGSVVRTSSRLGNVKTYLGETVGKDYRLAYQAAAATQATQLITVTECDGPIFCFSPTSLAWVQGNNGTFRIPDLSDLAPFIGYGDANTHPIITGDWNGDGKIDIARVGYTGVIAYVSTGNGWSRIADLPDLAGFVGYGDANANPIITGDWNGDGKTDIARVGATGVIAYISTGTGWTRIPDLSDLGSNYGAPNNYGTGSANPIITGDWNGDGRTDIARVHYTGVIAYVSTGNGWSRIADLPDLAGFVGYGDGDANPIITGDWNGDGKTDIARVHATGVIAYVSTGAGWTRIPDLSDFGSNYGPPNNYGSGTANPIITGDWNGDGKTDIARVHYTALVAYVATGNGWSRIADLPGIAPLDGYGDGNANPIITGDWNGDGKTDIARVHATGVIKFLSTGANWTRIPDLSDFGSNYGAPNNYGSGLANPIITGDWNGDGRTDMARVHYTGVIAYVEGSGQAQQVHALASLTNPFGAMTSVAFKPLTDSSLYSRDTGATYPSVDLQIPLYVVSSASSSNAAGGTVATTYVYGGLKSEAGTGRGLLGFRWRESTDQATGLKLRTEFRQDWPYVGLASLAKKTQSSGAIMSQTTNTYSCTNPVSGAACSVGAGNRYFPFLSQIVESGNDLNGAALPTVTTTSTYDAYGNVASVVIGTGDGYGKSTTNAYTNDPASWQLGRLTRSTVQSTIP